MVFLEQTGATERSNVRFLSEAVESHLMHAPAYYPAYGRHHTWADVICDPISRGLRVMVQTIESGVNRTIVAISVIVIAAAIVSVSSMAVWAFFQANNAAVVISEMSKRMDQGFSDLNRRLDDQRDRGNNGRSWP